MANCSYALNGQIPKDAQFTQAVRSQRFVGCVGKYNEVEAEQVTARTVIDSSNVLFYGAVPDLNTADAQAANLAAFSTALSEADCVIVPPGSYYFSSTIVIPANKKMSGCPLNTFIFSNADTAITIGRASMIENFSVVYNGTNTTTSIGILADEVLPVITNVSFSQTGAFAFGVVISGFEALVFNNALVTNSVIRGLVSALVIDGTAGNITNCKIVNNLLQTLAASTDIVTLTNASKNNFNGNSIQSTVTSTNGVNIDANSDFNVFIANQFNAVTNNYVDASLNSLIVGSDESNNMIVSGDQYEVQSVKVVGARGAAVADAAGGATVDAEARTAINTLLARLRATGGHGLIAD